jgi:hypothetical protein
VGWTTNARPSSLSAPGGRGEGRVRRERSPARFAAALGHAVDEGLPHPCQGAADAEVAGVLSGGGRPYGIGPGLSLQADPLVITEVRMPLRGADCSGAIPQRPRSKRARVVGLGAAPPHKPSHADPRRQTTSRPGDSAYLFLRAAWAKGQEPRGNARRLDGPPDAFDGAFDVLRFHGADDSCRTLCVPSFRGIRSERFREKMAPAPAGQPAFLPRLERGCLMPRMKPPQGVGADARRRRWWCAPWPETPPH